MADLLELSPEHKQAVLDAYASPEDPLSKEVIQTYESKSKPQYTNDGALVQPKFRAIADEEVAAVKPKSLGDKAVDVGASALEGAGKLGAGAAIGAAELVNPLSIPHGLEVLGRGAYEYATTPKSFAESIQTAEKDSVTAPMTLRQVAPIARSLVRAPFSDQSLVDVYDEEVASQEAFQGDPLVQGAQTATEIGGALGSIAMLARNVSKLPKVQQVFTKLKGIRAMKDPVSGLSRAQLKETAALQRQLLGDLAPELEKSLYENTAEVKRLLTGPQSGRSVMSTVEKVRSSLKTNRDLLGETIGEFRYALASERPDKFDTGFAIQRLNEFKGKQRLSGGMSTLDAKEAAALDNFQNLLKNSGKKGNYQFDTRDATVMVDKLDDYLKKQGFYEGKNKTTFNQEVYGLRDSIDAELAAKYPAYKEIKARYSDFLEDYSQIQNKIEGLGAESFVANLYGRNKSEVRELLERTLNRGQETKSAFQKAVMDSANISGESQKYNDVVSLMRKKAEGIEFQDGKALMQEVADKAMARKLAEISDPAADKLQSYINAYVSSKGKKVTGASTTAGSAVGTWLGMKMGNPAAGGMAGATAGFGLGRVIEGAREAAWRTTAEKLYSVERLLDTLEKEKKVAGDTKKMVQSVKWVWNKFGPEAGEAYLNKINMTSGFRRDFDYALSVLGGAQGLLKGTREKRSFADDIQKGEK